MKLRRLSCSEISSSRTQAGQQLAAFAAYRRWRCRRRFSTVPEPGAQPGPRGKLGSVARHGHQIRCCAMMSPASMPANGPAKSCTFVAAHRHAHVPVRLDIAVRIDHQSHLPAARVACSACWARGAPEELQPLVDAAHAAAAAAGEHKTRNIGFVDGHDSIMLSNLAGAHHRIS